MKIIENHFGGNTTILIHNRIINGCQDFTMEESQAILDEFEVSAYDWQPVLDLYTGVSTDEEIGSFINRSDVIVRVIVAQYGTNAHRDKLIDDVHEFVRENVACYGTDTHRDKLIDDVSHYVRMSIARHGNNAHRDKLINDEHECVRCAVARYGTDEHRLKLSNDKSRNVRSEVQRYMNK